MFPYGGICWTDHPHEGSHRCCCCLKLCSGQRVAAFQPAPTALQHGDGASPSSEDSKHPPEEVPPLLKAFTGPKLPLEPCAGVCGKSSSPSSYNTFTALCSVTSCPIVN